MKIELTEKEQEKLFNIKQDKLSLWCYSIETKKGKVVGSKFKTREDAVKQASKNLIIIIKSIIK